jgi:hypothetical protein
MGEGRTDESSPTVLMPDALRRSPAVASQQATLSGATSLSRGVMRPARRWPAAAVGSVAISLTVALVLAGILLLRPEPETAPSTQPEPELVDTPSSDADTDDDAEVDDAEVDAEVDDAEIDEAAPPATAAIEPAASASASARATTPWPASRQPAPRAPAPDARPEDVLGF